MDPPTAFCPNMDCVARGHTGRGNIKIHCRKRRRYRCTECGKTFSERQGTVFYHAHTPEETITLVLTLITYGCPVGAIEAAFGFQRRTVRQWLDKAGQHCRSVHQHLVLRPQCLQHVQVDELFVTTQRGLVYLFSALCVSTRLWLGGFITDKRDRAAARRLAQIVRRCAQMGPLLVLCDGFRPYREAFRRAFRWPLKTGRPGRPRLIAWSSLVVVQHIKQRHRVDLVQGTWKQFIALWHQVGQRVISTSYIERLNATFRQRLSTLTRRTRHLARTQETLEAGLHLLGCVYNFCHVHRSLGRTPAMAAGLASEVWTVRALLWYRLRPPRWRPPRHRGPLSQHERALLAQWGS